MSVSRGEIIALAGHKDNGQELFLRAVAGIKKISQGEIMFDEKILTGRPVSDFREAGICFVPDLKNNESLVPGMTVEDHFILSNDHESFIAWRMPARQSADEMADSFQIIAGPETHVAWLSKKDRLKLLLALLPEEPKIILIENPSKGLDPASANQMWSFLADHASDHGTVIFFSSSDIDEIQNISTRTVLFSDGKIIMDMPSKAVTESMIAKALEGNSN
jgi:simple sugar transport system ATP-binding protein